MTRAALAKMIAALALTVLEYHKAKIKLTFVTNAVRPIALVSTLDVGNLVDAILLFCRMMHNMPLAARALESVNL